MSYAERKAIDDVSLELRELNTTVKRLTRAVEGLVDMIEEAAAAEASEMGGQYETDD